jgi:predicted Zn-dependent protease
MTERQVDRFTGGLVDRMTGGQGPGRRVLFMVTVLLFAVYLSSCNEIAGPIRPDGYPYALHITDIVATTDTIDGVIYTAGDTITDTVDFKWPTSTLPVRIWAEQDSLDLPARMRGAIEAWSEILEYGEFAATMVGDSSHADIIVRDMVAPPPSAVRMGASTAACDGATDIQVSAPDHRRLWLPIRIYITVKYPLADTATVPCLARVAKHELGHAIGLFVHSPNSTDLMFAQPSVDAPSDVDIATVVWVYHQPTKLRPAWPSETLSTASRRPEP